MFDAVALLRALHGHIGVLAAAALLHPVLSLPADGPVRLTQPHIVYKFADPQLESASAGHKIMMRMGSQNALVVKTKLREIRAELVRSAVPVPVRQ